ncbi:AraC family transcriptional regulator [Gorillibacterium sp. sgz5001074]|uniref:AraC family transcriptional regulator n=1 Tax=Gorillibacterium sp. sgz5001074 TaxID=3446695 RepID=UPI003F663E05
MDWLNRMNGAIAYIEENLEGEIDYRTAAGIACCSVYHFQRMFSYMTDVPLSEYIRRRRLTLAAFELQQSGIKVIDVALKYGYESPEAFARAFQKLHGVAPTLSRSMGVNLKSYPRLSFHITIRGADEMNYRMVEKEAFAVFGVEEIFTTVDGENLKGIPQMWQRLMQDGTVDRLGMASGMDWKPGTPGICPVNAVMCYRDTGGASFPYMICAFDSEKARTEGYVRVEIPALTWAVFTTEEYSVEQTTAQVQSLWKRIYTEWFPMSGYEPETGPEFELYGTAESGLEYCEVWIPVKKKLG